jgi:tRNA(fMet)-specific endonuclease VapC
MPTLLLDTDVFSFLPKGDSRANAYIALLQGHPLALSFMTDAELFQVAPVDVEMCRIWGWLRAERQAAGRPIFPQDAWTRRQRFGLRCRWSRTTRATMRPSPRSMCARLHRSSA